ncbi:MAG: hypothetical protein KME42_09115 [Tildeniella nuda ZEHNDER 1965/U140]|nr:hypothetical protein [Tildeniella nuda ZEHNDER 1965/U140]
MSVLLDAVGRSSHNGTLWARYVVFQQSVNEGTQMVERHPVALRKVAHPVWLRPLLASKTL